MPGTSRTALVRLGRVRGVGVVVVAVLITYNYWDLTKQIPIWRYLYVSDAIVISKNSKPFLSERCRNLCVCRNMPWAARLLAFDVATGVFLTRPAVHRGGRLCLPTYATPTAKMHRWLEILGFEPKT